MIQEVGPTELHGELKLDLHEGSMLQSDHVDIGSHMDYRCLRQMIMLLIRIMCWSSL